MKVLYPSSLGPMVQTAGVLMVTQTRTCMQRANREMNNVSTNQLEQRATAAVCQHLETEADGPNDGRTDG